MRGKTLVPSDRSGLFRRTVALTLVFATITFTGCGGSAGNSNQTKYSQNITMSTTPASPVSFASNLTITVNATGGASGNPVTCLSTPPALQKEPSWATS